MGSPPRLRETHTKIVRFARRNRITPAPAGNTTLLMFLPRGSRDHPRACGKHSFQIIREVFRQGSPPRLRETPVCSIRVSIARGITPAPAGNTVVSTSAATIRQDHPRACGKHDERVGDEYVRTGSPPRLRETLCTHRSPNASARITPAPAGNTPAGTNVPSDAGDHPRACGKHVLAARSLAPLLGSPPRLRETHPAL